MVNKPYKKIIQKAKKIDRTKKQEDLKILSRLTRRYAFSLS